MVIEVFLVGPCSRWTFSIWLMYVAPVSLRDLGVFPPDLRLQSEKEKRREQKTQVGGELARKMDHISTEMGVLEMEPK